MLRALGILLTFFFVRWLFSVGQSHEPEITEEGTVFRCPRTTILVILICTVGLTAWGIYLALAQQDFWFAAFLIILGVLPWLFFPRKILISRTGVVRNGLSRVVRIEWADIDDLLYRRGPQTYTVKSKGGASISLSPLHAGGSRFRALTEQKTGLRYRETEM